jgi:hypothetical protein
MALQFKSATGFDYVSAATPLPVTIVSGSGGPYVLKAGDTMTGALGFGDDVELSRASAGQINVNGIGVAGKFAVSANGTVGGSIAYDGGTGGLLLDSNNAIFIRNNGTTLALTLDTSQRAIFAGPIRLNNAAVPATPTATHTLTVQDSGGTTYRLLCVV